jgi:16S rRNA (guanine527-N7)-methyltransferase
MSANQESLQLNQRLIEAGLEPLNSEAVARFETYISLFVRWNERVNLSSIRDYDEIISRHLIESIAVAWRLPQGIGSLLDFGSGGGFPGIPIALCRPEIAVTLAESQGRKAAFLEEAIRVVGIPAKVYAQRAETLRTQFDCVALRAVDRMAKAVASATLLVAPNGWLVLMTTDADLGLLHHAAGATFSWAEPVRLPGSDSGVLSLGQKVSA